ncbi:hypothetical protein PDE_01246 [Penicillium oxalicum 114-2]|uniref:Uncharacterized protein n=1 Tax=Penicillium oxalicum (strain 114-2 / CGMCC 5302) TaxID=933388 RepID=S7Z6Y7_PENO1|nr:hypothetical protein PDE_01246 [Penicillium oxalicum 114-2]
MSISGSAFVTGSGSSSTATFNAVSRATPGFAGIRGAHGLPRSVTSFMRGSVIGNGRPGLFGTIAQGGARNAEFTHNLSGFFWDKTNWQGSARREPSRSLFQACWVVGPASSGREHVGIKKSVILLSGRSLFRSYYYLASKETKLADINNPVVVEYRPYPSYRARRKGIGTKSDRFCDIFDFLVVGSPILKIFLSLISLLKFAILYKVLKRLPSPSKNLTIPKKYRIKLTLSLSRELSSSALLRKRLYRGRNFREIPEGWSHTTSTHGPTSADPLPREERLNTPETDQALSFLPPIVAKAYRTQLRNYIPDDYAKAVIRPYSGTIAQDATRVHLRDYERFFYKVSYLAGVGIPDTDKIIYA